MLPGTDTESRKRVLIAAHDSGQRRIWDMVLDRLAGEPGRSGFHISHGTTFTEATLLLRSQSFNVVVVDSALPDFAEMSALDRVFSESDSARVVVVVEPGDDAAGRAAVAAGAHDYLCRDEIGVSLVGRVLRHLDALAEAETGSGSPAESGFGAMFEQMADAVVVTRTDGTILWVNPAAETLFARTADLLLGQPFGFALKPGTTTEIDVYRGSAEPTVSGEVQTVTTSWNGDDAFLCVIRDVSDRRDVEKMQSEFISVISHELRTPLTSLKGSLRLLGIPNLNEEKRTDLMKIAHRNAERLQALVDDILSIEKLDIRGDLTMEVGRMDLVAVVKEAVDNIRPSFLEKKVGVRFSHNVEKLTVFGDGARINQVLENLLSNALEFSPEGELVDVDLTQRPDAVRVTVKDRGPGVPFNARHRIFGKFFQADSSDTRAKGGTGIGLTIAKAVVEQHEGRIGFDSEPGKGAEFWFELPYMPGG